MNPRALAERIREAIRDLEADPAEADPADAAQVASALAKLRGMLEAVERAIVEDAAGEDESRRYLLHVARWVRRIEPLQRARARAVQEPSRGETAEVVRGGRMRIEDIEEIGAEGGTPEEIAIRAALAPSVSGPAEDAIAKAATETAATAANAVVPGAGAIVRLLGPTVRKVVNALSDFFGGTHYDAARDYFRAVAKADAGLDLPKNAEIPAIIAACLGVGMIPLYCGSSENARKVTLAGFRSVGWDGKGYWRRYNKGWGRWTHWFGATLQTANAPDTIVQAATERTGTAYRAGLARTVALCLDIRPRLKEIKDGVSSWETTTLDAYPVLPPPSQLKGYL